MGVLTKEMRAIKERREKLFNAKNSATIALPTNEAEYQIEMPLPPDVEQVINARTRKTDELSSRPLPLQYVISNLTQRAEAQRLYGGLLMYIPFVAFFFVFYLYGRDISNNHYAVGATRDAYLKYEFPLPTENARRISSWSPTQARTSRALPEDRYFGTVERASDVLKWFEDVFIPQTWDCENPDFSHNPLIRRGQQTLIGAVSLRIVNSPRDSCRWNSAFNAPSWPSRNCYGAYGAGLDQSPVCANTNPAHTPQNLWTYNPTVGSLTYGKHSTYFAGGYSATLPFNATCNQVRQFFDIMAKNKSCLIVGDDRTRLFMLEWFQYNPSTDTFVSAKLFFEGTQGGSWFSNYQVRAFPVWSIQRLGTSIFDIFFLLLSFYFWYCFIVDWVEYVRVHNSFFAFLLDIWKLIELTNLVTLLVVIVLRFVWWAQCVAQSPSVPFPATVYPLSLDGILLTFSSQIYANAVNAVMTVLQLLKFFRLNNRLNVVTKTLDACKNSLGGILAIFVYIVLAYALSATALYGSNIEAFQNVNTAFSSLLFFLFGAFDYVQMQQQQPFLTAIFFFSYIIIMQFIILNFIIAILSEGFSQVRRSTSVEPLDKVLLREIYLLQYRLNPRLIRNAISVSLKGKSRAEVLREMCKYLQEHMNLIEIESPELLDQDLPITKSDLKHWFPENLAQELGNDYLDLLWDDIDHDLQTDSLSAGYQMRKKIEQVVLHAMRSITVKPLKEFRNAPPIAARLETKVARFAELMRNY